MQLKYKLCFIVFSFFIFASNISAQVVINEFSSTTSNDWVEIYNNSDAVEDLSNYSLVDGSDSGNIKSFSCLLNPKGFFIVEWSNKLNNGGDIIKLKKNDSLIDCIAYKDGAGQICERKTEVDLKDLSDGNFVARSQDGTDSWTVTALSTKDKPNDGSEKDVNAVCFTPTPTPTPEPTDELIEDLTFSPTSSPTVKPTSTPLTTKINTLKPTTTPIPELTKESMKEEVLGIQNENVNPSPTEESEESSEKSKVSILSILFIVLGISFVGFSGFAFFKQKRLNNNEGEKNSEII